MPPVFYDLTARLAAMDLGFLTLRGFANLLAERIASVAGEPHSQLSLPSPVSTRSSAEPRWRSRFLVRLFRGTRRGVARPDEPAMMSRAGSWQGIPDKR